MLNRTNSLYLMTACFLFFSCEKEITIETGGNLADWAIETHTELASPNYDVVFNQTAVNRIDIVLTAEEWNDMQSDLADVLSQGGGGPGGMTFSEQTPEYFPCDFYFNGKQWYDVGIRYKGNSSLSSSYQSKIGKLPFRLDFDQFEEENPAILNQRFYGFKELSLGNNYKDLSLMREKTASDLFRAFGVPAVRTAFYEVYVDNGSGSEYYGLYTLNEVVFDTFLKDYFGNDNGNCYKPDGDGAKFSASNFDLDDFELKTNEVPGDKSDIIKLHDALHSSSRTSNPEQWKSELESIFDVDGFLRYLAVNNTIQNWDTYGNMTHNYYLYHDETDGIIKWIVWDNNEAFSSGAGRNSALSFAMSEVGTDWPLINYIIKDSEYLSTYKSYIKSFVETSFELNKMQNTYTSQQNLLNSSASNERAGYTFLSNYNSFYNAVGTLKSHCSTRINAAISYIQ